MKIQYYCSRSVAVTYPNIIQCVMPMDGNILFTGWHIVLISDGSCGISVCRIC